MKNEKIYSVVVDGKIYFVDESGNFYDQIVQRGKGMNGLGFNLISRLREKAIAEGRYVPSGNVDDSGRFVETQTEYEAQQVERNKVIDAIKSGRTAIQEVGNTVKNLFNKDQNINPTNTGVVQSGAYVNDAGQVYKNAGMNIDFNNKWVMIGGGLLAVGVIFYFVNQSDNKAKATKKAK